MKDAIYAIRGHLKEPYPFEHMFFPAGESHVKLGELPRYANDCSGFQIHIGWKGDQSLFKLAMMVDALRRLDSSKPIHAFIPYFPGARQDRPCNPGEPLGAKVYADFVNSLKLASVTILDSHSDVTPALLDNCKVIPQWLIAEKFLPVPMNRNTLLVCPDGGAAKKIINLAEKLHHEAILFATKNRNSTTGRLTECSISEEETGCQWLSEHNCWIVDDICSYGGTFKNLAKKLKEAGALSVHLIVTHYEGVASEHQLKEAGIDGVYTTNSLFDPPVNQSFIKSLNCETLI